MPDETEGAPPVAVAEAPPPVAEPTAGFGQPQEGAEEAPPQEGPEPFESLLTRITAEDSPWKSDYDAHQETVRKESHKKGMSEAQSRLQPMLQRYTQAAAGSLQALQEIDKGMKQLVKEGTLDNETYQELLKTHSGWQNLIGLTHEQGTYAGAKNLMYLMAQKLDNAELYSNYASRVDAAQLGSDTAEAIAADYLDAVVEAAEKKAEERGYKRGLKAGKEGTVEQFKEQSRTGKGPDMAPKKGGPGRSDRELMLDPNTPIDTLEAIRTRQRVG